MNVELQIFTIGNQGQGVGRDPEGNTYYVSGALPGDRVEVVTNEEGRHREGTVHHLIEASAERVASPCRYSDSCGGCDWMGWKYEAQTAAKERLLHHSLQRFDLVPKVNHPFIPAESNLQYRSRIQLRAENGKLGFLKRGSHEVVDIESCAVAVEPLNKKIAELRAELSGANADVDDGGEPSDRQKIELGVSDDGQVWSAINQPHAAMGFTQVHPAQNENLKQIVAKAVANSFGQNVLELFCGDGNLTFAAVGPTKRWQGVEVDAASVGRANQKAMELGFEPQRLKFGRADLFSMGAAKRWREIGYDTLVLDPPRSGMGKTLTHFVHPKLNNIIYTSCSLQSFITDVVPLKNDFVLEEVWALDMFPHTRHFEIVARFSRR